MKRFCKVEMTAASTSSTIHKARDNVSGAIVCLKKVSLDGGEMGIPYAVLREISLHKLLQHPNVIRLDEVVRFKSKIGMVFECIESSLCDLLAQHRSSGGIPIDVIKSYTFQMLRAIAFCHDRQVLHRDLKPENVFVTRRGAVKLGNFSSARAYGSSLTLTQERVKIWYRCPETLLGAKHYSTAVDMWSIGCIIAELASDEPLFPGDGSEVCQLVLIFKAVGTPTEETWPGVASLPFYIPVFPLWRPQDIGESLPRLGAAGAALVARALCCDPARRISAAAALGAAFLDDAEER